LPGKSNTRGGIVVVAELIGATAVLHGADGMVLGKCHTPCSFNDRWSSRYNLEMQEDGYRSVQIPVLVIAGEVLEEKIELEAFSPKTRSAMRSR
jgi:hypothetical protein